MTPDDVARRPPGRPRATVKSYPLSTRVLGAHLDQVIQIAHRRGASVAAVTRGFIVRSLEAEKKKR